MQVGRTGRRDARVLHRLASACIAFAAVTAALPPASAAPLQESREHQLKSAYLLNFLKFVEWPPAALSDALTVCFASADPIHDALVAGIEDKRVGPRRLILRRLQPAENAGGCNVLYVDAAAPANDSRLAAVRNLPVLTVSDAAGFARNGGMIELFTDSNRLRFNVNVDTAQDAGLRISANLLQLAAAVEKGKGA
jgi:hypothetical protein